MLISYLLMMDDWTKGMPLAKIGRIREENKPTSLGDKHRVRSWEDLDGEIVLAPLELGSSGPPCRAARKGGGNIRKITGPHRKNVAALGKMDFLSRSRALRTTRTAAMSPPGNTLGMSDGKGERFLGPQKITASHVFRVCRAVPWLHSSLKQHTPK